MKVIYYLATLALVSCASSESLVYNIDNFKKVETLMLKVSLDGYSIQRTRPKVLPDYNFSFTFLHQRPVIGNYLTSIKLSVKTDLNQKTLNPGLYIVTDNDTTLVDGMDYFENIYSINTTTSESKTSSEDNKVDNKEVISTITSTPNQLMEYTYRINADIAKKISYSDRLVFRVYIGEVGIDITPDLSRKEKIANFFKKTLTAPGNLKNII
jgi:hypothetical protein